MVAHVADAAADANAGSSPVEGHLVAHIRARTPKAVLVQNATNVSAAAWHSGQHMLTHGITLPTAMECFHLVVNTSQ